MLLSVIVCCKSAARLLCGTDDANMRAKIWSVLWPPPDHKYQRGTLFAQTLIGCSFVRLFCVVLMPQSSRSQNLKISHKDALPRAAVLLCIIPSAICSLIYSPSPWRPVFIYEGTKRNLSALSWSRWQYIVWLWCRKWIVLLQRKPCALASDCFHQCSSPAYLRSLSLIINVLLLFLFNGDGAPLWDSN